MNTVSRSFWDAIQQIENNIENGEFEIALWENVRLSDIRKYYKGRYELKFSLISEKNCVRAYKVKAKVV